MSKKVTYKELSPNKVLAAAIGNLSKVVIMGYDKEGNEYFASSVATCGEVIWLAERIKKQLLEDKAHDKT